MGVTVFLWFNYCALWKPLMNFSRDVLLTSHTEASLLYSAFSCCFYEEKFRRFSHICRCFPYGPKTKNCFWVQVSQTSLLNSTNYRVPSPIGLPSLNQRYLPQAPWLITPQASIPNGRFASLRISTLIIHPILSSFLVVNTKPIRRIARSCGVKGRWRR